LHKLSLEGKWDEMRKIIPEDVLHGFAQTSTYDNLPNFLRENREYASRTGLGMPTRTPAERERFQHVLAEVKKVRVPGVPRGLEIKKGARAGA
jgi:hypothetical protein